MSRRQFMTVGAVVGVSVAGGLVIRSFRNAERTYEDAVQRTWRPIE